MMVSPTRFPHPVIEIRKWDRAGVLGRHLSILAVRTAHAIAYFTNSKTGEAWPSVETLRSMVVVHERSLRRALGELGRFGIPFERVRRKVVYGHGGRPYFGPHVWSVVPFDKQRAEELLQQPYRRTRRGRFHAMLGDFRPGSSVRSKGIFQTGRRSPSDRAQRPP